jgi:hypothetical protein
MHQGFPLSDLHRYSLGVKGQSSVDLDIPKICLMDSCEAKLSNDIGLKAIREQYIVQN